MSDVQRWEAGEPEATLCPECLRLLFPGETCHLGPWPAPVTLRVTGVDAENGVITFEAAP